MGRPKGSGNPKIYEIGRDALLSRMTEAEYEQHRLEVSRKGGLAKVPKGFAITGRAAAIEAGRKGGLASRKRKKRASR